MKTIKIVINSQLDSIQTEVILPQGNNKIAHRWKSSHSSPERENHLLQAKADCFDLLWEYTEMGLKAEIVPYIN